MSFTDHKITQFAHRVADLPDEPQIPAADLKSRFDACPEELRQSLNAVCDDAARLEARVEGIVVDTFGDTIDKEMLSDELAAELDGKATQSALSAEAAARESADDALETANSALATTVASKCAVYCGSYDGNGNASQDINLGFRPKAVLLLQQDNNLVYLGNNSGNYCYGGLFFDGGPLIFNFSDMNITCAEVTDNGFKVYQHSDTQYTGSSTNENYATYIYMALH